MKGIFGWTPAALLLAGLVAAAPASAQEEDEEAAPQRFGDWSLVCPTVRENRLCQLRQFFIQRNEEGETRRQIMRVTVLRRVATGDDVLAITLPLGSDLQKGATYKVSDRIELPGLEYSFCSRDGCYVEVPLTSNILAEMRNGLEGEVRFFAYNREQEITIPVSFEGFANAYSAFLLEQ